MKRLALMLACFFISMGLAIAQNRQISGIVVDESGESVIGASVVVKGTTTGTVTGVDGRFSLNVPTSATTLIVKYIGMTDQEVPVSDNVKVEMKTSSEMLDELIVVAYGTAKKAAFTGSAANVKSETISKRQVSNVTNALSGQVAGLQTTSSNGQPGSAATVRIRGIGSMTASNNPLYIVDGVPFEGNLASINNMDIESVSVLKDASASAIYGARGANGVIIVTTKRGKSKEAQITFDGRIGTNSRGVPEYNVMTDPAMYYETYYKGLYNSKAYAGATPEDAHAYARNTIFSADAGLGMQVYTYPEGENFIGSNFKMNPNATLGYRDNSYYYTPDDWYDETFNKETNLRQEYNLSISGSNDKMNYYFSAGYLDDTGIIPNSGFTRFTVRSNMDYQARKWLKIGANVGYTYYDSKAPGGQREWGSSGNVFQYTSTIAPIYPIYVRNTDGSIRVDNNGNTVYDFGSSTNQKRVFLNGGNPMGSLQLDDYSALTDVLTSKYYAIIDIWDGLQFTTNIGVNTLNQRATSLFNPFYGSSVSDQGNVEVEAFRRFGLNQQYLLTYKKDINEHHLDILAGYESFAYKSQYLGGSNKILYNPTIDELGNAIYDTPKVDSYTDDYTTVGFLSRVQYDYDNKIFLSGSYRRDASSRFHPDNRWGNFGSIGAAWVISKEEFFENLNQSWIDFLKIKTSYGVQGNDNLYYADGTVNYYPYADQFKVSNNGAGDFAVTKSYKGNKDITWETSYGFNAGIEFNLFEERLTGSIDYFNRKTVDLLYNVPVPISLGYPGDTYPMNVGSIRNYGMEYDFSFDIIKNRELTWTFNINATTLNNKILELAGVVRETGVKRTVTIWKEGGSLFDIFLRESAGVDENTGKELWYMVNSQGEYVLDENGKKTTTDVWTATNQVQKGNSLADVYGGFGTAISYKGFDLSLAFSYQLGGKLYDFTYQELMHNGDQQGINWHKDILNAWTEENRHTNIPRLNNSDDSYQQLSTRFLKSSNYLSLNNLTFGYTLPEKLTKKIDISSVRVYFTGDNLALFSARQGLDPRQILGANDYRNSGAYMYTALRTLSGGLTVTF